MFWWLLGLYCVTTFGPTIPATAFAPPSPAPLVDSVAAIATPPQFAVRFGEDLSRHEVMAMYVLPGAVVPIAVEAPADTADYTLRCAAGETRTDGPGRWTWTGPAAPGMYPLEVRGAGNGTMLLNVFVMVPFGDMVRGRLNGYRIGRYPASQPGYARPDGFVEVRPGMEDVRLSPHFTLGQFLCKQKGGPNRYVALRQPLLAKLEELLAAFNARGHRARTFAVMSAFRTPHYNAAIGNRTTRSRHHYGDAADIYVDEDGDGIMDDLNRDGRHTLDDARVLSEIVEDTQHEPRFAGLTGGLSAYHPTHAHGAFVHIDVRGVPARWQQ